MNILYKSQTKSGFFLLGAGLSPAFNLNNYYGSGIKKFDLGINAIVGYLLMIGFSINLGYTYGLLNTIANKNNYVSSIQNRYFSFTMGYEF